MGDFEKKLEKYAELVIHVGLNVQKGQTVFINSDVHNLELVRKLAEKAYRAGAKHVYTDFSDEQLTRTKFLLAPDDAFEEYPSWRARAMEELAENGAAFLSISSSGPDILKGIDSKRFATFSRVANRAMEKYRDYIQGDRVAWAVIGGASQSWADKVFPDLPEEERVEKLWDAIFAACRIDQDDPVTAWKEHDRKLKKMVNYLNEKRYAKLHYRAPGTDLTVELPDEHQWLGGSSTTPQHVPFMANIPTEEVFTVPKRDGVNGYVRSTKPLSYGGNLIENFTLTFEKGRIINIQAEKGEDILKHLVESDEGSHFLGEAALVPHRSPISQMDILFYNTLFDENASNHFAIGNGYAECIRNGKAMNRKQLEAHGMNSSIVHVDFMVGSADMDIDGITKDGIIEPIFRKGNWAFE
jgi:aminopeptidase II. Metallo peptidase. MEROPS family M29